MKKKLWYYTEKYGTSIYEKKPNIVDYSKTKRFSFIMEKTYGNILNLLWRNHGTMAKNMVLWKKRWFYEKNIESVRRN